MRRPTLVRLAAVVLVAVPVIGMAVPAQAAPPKPVAHLAPPLCC
jgi:hypothetical protein